MKRLSTLRQPKTKQPVLRRLFRLYSAPVVKRGGRRAKKISFRFYKRWRVQLSVRFFRTNKTSRSTRSNRIVVPLYAVAVKEIAVSWQRTRKTKRQPNEGMRAQLFPLSLVLLGVLLSIHFALQLTPKKPVLAAPKVTTQPVAPKIVHPKTLPRAEPDAIAIDKIGVHATVISEGTWSDGSLQIPTDGQSVGWYKNSPTPGELGPAVLAGHLDTIKGPAVFWRLNELAPGDVITILRSDKSSAQFKVDSVKQYPQADLPANEIYGNINYAGLRLITCGGTFNFVTRHYSTNIVVFASLLN